VLSGTINTAFKKALYPASREDFGLFVPKSSLTL
jgi:hypothetical protein